MRTILGDPGDLEVDVKDKSGTTRSRFNFQSIVRNSCIARELKESFLQSMSHLSLESQRQAFRCCRKFGQFLEEKKLAAAEPLPTDLLLRFRKWLDDKDLDTSTKQSILNVVISIVREMESHGVTALPQGLRFDVPGFKRGPTAPQRNVLGESELRLIWRVAVERLTACEKRIAAGRAVLIDPKSALGSLLRTLLQIGNGNIPSERVVARSRLSLARRVREAGGHAKLNALLFPNVQDCCAAFICVLIQTGGNPYAIHNLSVDCIKPHALRADVEWLIWIKERSKSEQKVESLKGKAFGPTNLVRLWLNLTSSVRQRAKDDDRTKLFIAMTKCGARLPCFQNFHLALDEFIKDNSLPQFDFKDIRTAEANLIYQETRDIREVRIRLNHRSLRTTARYLNTRATSEQNSALISKFQGLIVRMAEDARKEEEPISMRTSRSGRAFRTIFGFDCIDPFQGIAEGSRPHELCPSFQRCATCPGAIVPLDDVSVIARLIQSQRALIEMEAVAAAGGWLPRFKELYAPTLRVIVEDLLPNVSADVFAAASEHSVPPLPGLE